MQKGRQAALPAIWQPFANYAALIATIAANPSPRPVAPPPSADWCHLDKIDLNSKNRTELCFLR